MPCYDYIPRVDGARGAHKHRENAVGGENGGFVFLGEVLDDGVRGGSDVVDRAVFDVELALRVLHRGFVEGAVIVVEEAVGVDVFAGAGVEVELGKPVEVDLFQHIPVGLDGYGRVAVALGLIVVFPAKSTPSASTSASIVVIALLLTTSLPCPLHCSSGATLCLCSSPSSSKDRSSTPSESSGFVGGPCIVDYRE